MQNYFLLLHSMPILQSLSLSEINMSSLKPGFPGSTLFRSSINKADVQLPVLLGQIVQYLYFCRDWPILRREKETAGRGMVIADKTQVSTVSQK